MMNHAERCSFERMRTILRAINESLENGNPILPDPNIKKDDDKTIPEEVQSVLFYADAHVPEQ